jgi:hypothetical protein
VWRTREPSERLVAMLAAAAAAHVAWWLTLSSSGWPRHLAPGLVYLAAAAAVAVGRWPLPGRSIALAACVLVALASRANRVGEVVARPPFFEPSPRTRSMLAAAHFLERLDPGRPMVAISWASVEDLEYLAPTARNFVAERFVAAADRPGRYLVANRRWDAKTPELAEEWQRRVDAWHGELVFEDGQYMVYRAGDAEPPAATKAGDRSHEPPPRRSRMACRRPGASFAHPAKIPSMSMPAKSHSAKSKPPRPSPSQRAPNTSEKTKG